MAYRALHTDLCKLYSLIVHLLVPIPTPCLLHWPPSFLKHQDMLCLRAFAPSSGPFPKVVLLLRSTSLPPSPPSAWFGHLFKETLPEWD